MGPFISQKTVSISFFTDRSAGTFFATGESAYYHSMDCLFESASSEQTYGYPIYKQFFWTWTCFSVHIIYTSANFTWITLLNYQKVL